MLKKIIWKYGIRIAIEIVAIVILSILSGTMLTGSSDILMFLGFGGFVLVFLGTITAIVKNYVDIKRDVSSFKEIHGIMGDDAL